MEYLIQHMLLLLAVVLMTAPAPASATPPPKCGLLVEDTTPFGTTRQLQQTQSDADPLDTDIANRSQAIKACSASTNAYRPWNSTTINALTPVPEKTEWPEVACQPYTVAAAVIVLERPDVNVTVIPSDAATILNYDASRVFLRVNGQELVDPAFTPAVG